MHASMRCQEVGLLDHLFVSEACIAHSGVELEWIVKVFMVSNQLAGAFDTDLVLIESDLSAASR